MTPDESFQTPFDTDTDTDTDMPTSDQSFATDDTELSDGDSDQQDPDVTAAKEAWDADQVTEEDNQEIAELAQPFVGQWNSLISTTNWEKGRIISQWREALVESGVDSTAYSDEAWAKRVGGVTAPHVGRLRRVYDRFGSTFATYDDVYWTHFLAALDWDDAPMWLEGASKEKWSVSVMREKRWEATGAVESNRPTNSQIVEVDLDEDITLPAQGGGREKDFDGESSGVASGPVYEEPDFGDAEELAALGKNDDDETDSSDQSPKPTVQPFVGLPKLPDDLTEAVESFKLALLRHKSAGWNEVTENEVQQYLDAIGVMIRS